jgi:DNA-binding transcriptional ArsR family regulator
MVTLAHPNATTMKAKLFAGFADPTRLAILETLSGGPRTVGEIVERTCLRQSNVSNHLACLRGCGLVVGEKQGRYVYYQLSDPRIENMLSLSAEIVAEVARGLYQCTHSAGEEA